MKINTIWSHLCVESKKQQQQKTKTKWKETHRYKQQISSVGKGLDDWAK